MRLIAYAVAGFVMIGAGAASAQPMWGPDQGRFYGPDRAPRWQRDLGPLDPRQVAYVVESMGLDPVGPPLQTGRLVVQRAADEFGRVVRVTINLNNGRVVSVAPLGAPPPVNAGPYAAYRPYGPGPYARPAPEADDDDEFAPPGPVMAPRAALPPGAMPPPGIAPPPRAAAVTPAYPANPHPPVPPQGETHKPAAKSATATPAQPPKPRKRPEGAETAKKAEPGSVAPMQATPAPAEGTPASPSTAMPPVAPLE